MKSNIRFASVLTAVCVAFGFAGAYFGTAFAADETADASNGDCVLKVMSFNILVGPDGIEGAEGWDARKGDVVDVIKEAAPTVFGVQEALANQTDYLNAELPEYASIGVGRDDGKRGGEAMAIFYKKDAVELLDGGTFWLSQTPDVPGSKGWDAMCNRTVTWCKFRCKKTGKLFAYANTHLDHIGTVAREEGAKLIMRRLHSIIGDGPYFVSGDFNVTEGSEAYKTMTEGVDGLPGLRDSNKVAKEREIAQPRTFNDFGNVPVERGEIIDFIFVNDKVEVEKFKINPDKRPNGRYASDHCSIVATLRLLD